MRALVFTKAIKKDFVRLKKCGHKREKLEFVVEFLRLNGVAPLSTKPHKLNGIWAGYWECHIEYDWLLIYKCDESEVILYRSGSHPDLFE